jgi:hypothetical protein
MDPVHLAFAAACTGSNRPKDRTFGTFSTLFGTTVTVAVPGSGVGVTSPVPRPQVPIPGSGVGVTSPVPRPQVPIPGSGVGVTSPVPRPQVQRQVIDPHDLCGQDVTQVNYELRGLAVHHKVPEKLLAT